MATTYDFDLFTIGAGSGGVAASRRAASYGAKVALAENSRVGGTCVMRGCVPKKLLVYGAQFADAFEDAAGYGWHVAPPTFDWTTLIANKNRELDRLETVYRKLLKDSGCTLLEARATLIDAHTIALSTGKHVTAETILIATGSHPVMPKIPGIEHVVTSNEALDLPKLPRHIIIVGGGYIALEFANIFSAFKTDVTLVIRGEEVLNGFDDDVRVDIAKEMHQRGITIHTRTELERIEEIQGGFTVRTKAGAELSADLVMYATGRKPTVKGLGLAETGVKLHDDSRIIVDEWSKTSVPNIYAIGDVTDRLNLTPVAIAEGRAIAETLYNRNPLKISHENVATAVFSQPPIGTVGLSESQARKRGHKLDIYRARFKPMKNTLSGREERTMMKLVVDRTTQKVLGIHMVGVDAPEIVQSLAVAIVCGVTKQQLDRTMAVHPTAAEEFVTMRDKLPAMDNEAIE
jgi:glutathione reductase (NADPH)